MRCIALVAALAIGCSGTKSPLPTCTTLKRGTALAVDQVTTIWRAYDNEAAGDLAYSGVLVEFMVQGPVQKDRNGRYFVSSNVSTCYVVAEDAPKLASSKGPIPTFRLQGTCRGRHDTSGAINGYEVVIEDCRVVKVLEFTKKGWQ